jgi:hypothetical protein
MMTVEVLEVIEETEAEEVARQMLDGVLPVVEEPQPGDPGTLTFGGQTFTQEQMSAILEPFRTPERQREYLNQFDWGSTPEPEHVWVGRGQPAEYYQGYCGPNRRGVFTGGEYVQIGAYERLKYCEHLLENCGGAQWEKA